MYTGNSAIVCVQAVCSSANTLVNGNVVQPDQFCVSPVLLLMFLAPLLICCSAEEKPVDCSDILQQDPHSSSGVYTIYPFHRQLGVPVYCDMETNEGGWTIIQRRMDGSVNFYRPWDQYVEGFGDANREYWFGLEFMHKITARGKKRAAGGDGGF
ncbi:hypothetical protein WMY93_028235 [Mugilogobius chulae]|uniref:Fibrinogen C-terminal domain-containing protein n=1 Tax=Mugilogobius chulae TaxID=88201 RepID=A0AAW0MTZ8_9GOBI